MKGIRVTSDFTHCRVYRKAKKEPLPSWPPGHTPRLLTIFGVASQCLGYSLCAKFRVVFKIPKVPNSLSVQISGSFINEAWYHFWPNI